MCIRDSDQLFDELFEVALHLHLLQAIAHFFVKHFTVEQRLFERALQLVQSLLTLRQFIPEIVVKSALQKMCIRDRDECNRKQGEEAKQSKVKALVFDRLLYRHWNAYKEGKRTHIFVLPVPAEIPLKTAVAVDDMPRPRDLTPGDFDAPVFSLGGQDNYAFSPDGQEICYTSNHDKVEDVYKRQVLAVRCRDNVQCGSTRNRLACSRGRIHFT